MRMTLNSRGGTTKRRLLNAALAVAVSAFMVLGVAVPADAKDLGAWAWSHNAGQTFLQTTTGDNNTYVTRARVQHMDFAAPTTTYCGAQARVGGTLTSGAAWSKTFGYEAACNFVMVDETVAPKKYFKGTAKFWGKAYHDSAWTPGQPYVYP